MTKKWFADHGFGDEEISAFSEAYADLARVAPDRPVGPPLTKDPGDNFIVRLAQTTGSVLVTRDAGILANHPEMVPVLSPGDFAETLVQWQTHPPRYRLAADSNGALTLGF